jgi:hypothetical protein
LLKATNASSSYAQWKKTVQLELDDLSKQAGVVFNSLGTSAIKSADMNSLNLEAMEDRVESCEVTSRDLIKLVVDKIHTAEIAINVRHVVPNDLIAVGQGGSNALQGFTLTPVGEPVLDSGPWTVSHRVHKDHLRAFRTYTLNQSGEVLGSISIEVAIGLSVSDSENGSHVIVRPFGSPGILIKGIDNDTFPIDLEAEIRKRLMTALLAVDQKVTIDHIALTSSQTVRMFSARTGDGAIRLFGSSGARRTVPAALAPYPAADDAVVVKLHKAEIDEIINSESSKFQLPPDASLGIVLAPQEQRILILVNASRHVSINVVSVGIEATLVANATQKIQLSVSGSSLISANDGDIQAYGHFKDVDAYIEVDLGSLLGKHRTSVGLPDEGATMLIDMAAELGLSLKRSIPNDVHMASQAPGLSLHSVSVRDTDIVINASATA